MNNKRAGTRFEHELCEMLAARGFWVRELVPNAAGQPADIIAVKNNRAHLIDAKDMTSDRFPLSRIEENQELAMSRWEECGNKTAWFAIWHDGEIRLLSYEVHRLMLKLKLKSLTWDTIKQYSYTLDEWEDDCL